MTEQEFIPSKQARVFGPLTLAGGIAFAAVGVWSFFDAAEIPFWTRVLQGAVPILVGGLLIVGGRMLANRRGGIVLTDEYILLFGDSQEDQLQVPLDRVTTFLVHAVEERWGEVRHTQWYLEALIADGPRVLLGESDDEHELKHYAHQLAAAAGHGVPTEKVTPHHYSTTPPNAPRPRAVGHLKRGFKFTVGSQGHLAATLWCGGLSMGLVGVLLMVDIANNSVAGFLFGPLLCFLGIAFVAVPLGKNLLSEHVQIEDGQMSHSYDMLGLQFWRREIPIAADFYVRLRQRGLLGASLEIVSDGHIRHLAGGVHAGTRIDLPALMWLGQSLAAMARTSRTASPQSPQPPIPQPPA